MSTRWSKSITIQPTGRQTCEVGGQAIDRRGDELGVDSAPRSGLVWIRPANDLGRQAEANLKGCEAWETGWLRGYQRVSIDLPCQIDFRGPPGAQLLVIAWDDGATGERGAAFSEYGGSVHTIPPWARTLDSASAVQVFDAVAAPLGTIGPGVGVTIPPEALTAQGGANPVTYRQG